MPHLSILGRSSLPSWW